MTSFFRLEILLLGVVLVLTGCKRGAGLPDRHVKRKISTTEIIGTWVITDKALDALVKKGYSKYPKKQDHRLELFGDGTCRISAYLYTPCSPTIDDQERYYKSLASGTWKISQTDTYVRHRRVKVQAVNIKLQKISANSESVSIESHGLTFFIWQDNRGLVLWNYIGDPDYRQYMDFVHFFD